MKQRTRFSFEPFNVWGDMPADESQIVALQVRLQMQFAVGANIAHFVAVWAVANGEFRGKEWTDVELRHAIWAADAAWAQRNA